MQFNVTDDQAMRMPYDLDNDGVLDYIITRDYVMRGTDVEGTIYWDVGGDGNFTEDVDRNIPGVIVYAQELTTKATVILDASDGSFTTKLAPGKYKLYALVLGVDMTISESFNVSAGTKATPKLGVVPASVSGTISYKDGTAAASVELILGTDSGPVTTVTTDTAGNYTLSYLVEGQYTLSANLSGYMLFASGLTIKEGDKISFTTPGSRAPLTGMVYARESKIDAATLTLRLRALSANPDGSLTARSVANVELMFAERDALVIPSYALVPELKGQKIFLLKGGKAVPQSVEIGIRTEERVEISGGVQEGDTLITSGMLQIRPGMTVRAAEAGAAEPKPAEQEPAG